MGNAVVFIIVGLIAWAWLGYEDWRDARRERALWRKTDDECDNGCIWHG